MKIENVKIYVICDRVANTCGDLIVKVNDEVALRWFKWVCSKLTDVQPCDLDLYCVGTCSADTGAITNAYERPQFVINGGNLYEEKTE